MEATSWEIQELRTKFLQKVEEENRDFHTKDLARVNNDDDWVRRFLIHHDLEMKDALAMLLDTCEWRKINRVNEMNEQSVLLDYLEEGSLFIHNRDKDGKSLFIFKCKKHVKGQKDLEELKKCVIYWFERIERQDKGNQITIFFDMADTGLTNMDMEYTNYLIDLCKSYYPHFLNYILIFEMPWVLNAAFKIIKTWLPSKAVQKIKFVTKNSLKDYVDPDQALKCWGGTDDYEFVFLPENIGDGNKAEDNKRKVHFADGSPISDNCPTSFGDSKQEESSNSSKVRITPYDAIAFHEEGIEFVGTVTITNISESCITYKVKTTSPEKFRVRPSCGIIGPNGTSASIALTLQAGYSAASIGRDKFLIMTFPVDRDCSSSDLNEIWKSCDSRKVDQHRLKCIAPVNGTPNDTTGVANPDIDQKMSQLLVTVNHLSECNSKLHGEVKFAQTLSWFILIVVTFFGVALAFYLGRSGNSPMHCYRPGNVPND